MLLQESLRQVFQLTLGELQIRRAGNSQLSAILADNNVIGCQSTSLPRELDSFLQVGLEQPHVENFIIDGLRAVDDEFDNVLLSLDLIVKPIN